MIPNGARYTGLIVVRLDSLDGLITGAGALAQLNARRKLFSRRETKLSNRISVLDALRPGTDDAQCGSTSTPPFVTERPS